MDKGLKYLIYRIYSAKERPEMNERSVFYGWTSSKKVAKAFLKQRDKNKYRAIKMNDEEIIQNIPYSDEIITVESMIDFVKLRSAKTHEDIYFFTT